MSPPITARRAEGGVGLILTEGTSPEHKSASNDVNVPALLRRGIAGRLGERAEGSESGRRPHHAAALASGHRAPSRVAGPIPRSKSMGPSGLSQAGQEGRRADDRQRDRRRHRGLREERGLRQGARLRRRRTARRARLPHRPVLLGGHQPARRQLWRLAGKAHQLCRRHHARRAQGRGRGLPDPAALLAMEAAGFRRAARAHAGRARTIPEAAGRCGRRHVPLLDAPVLGAGISRRRVRT